LLNYILEAIQENLLTLSSADNEVIGIIDALQVLQFIANNWRRISTKTIEKSSDHCGLNTHHLDMPNKADSEIDVMLETHHVGHYEEFSCIESSLQSYNKY
jgi:hypothetical protein